MQRESGSLGAEFEVLVALLSLAIEYVIPGPAIEYAHPSLFNIEFDCRSTYIILHRVAISHAKSS